MDDLCSTCLCSGRTLYVLEETEYYHMYLQILNEIQVYSLQLCRKMLDEQPVQIQNSKVYSVSRPQGHFYMSFESTGISQEETAAEKKRRKKLNSVLVCWECRAVLGRCQRFQRQARRCQQLLQQATPKYALIQPPRLSAQRVTSHSYPPLDVKTEPCSDAVPLLDTVKVEAEESVEEHCEPETFVYELELEKSEDLKKPIKKKKKKLKGSKKKKKIEEPLSDGFSDRDANCDNDGKDDNDEKYDDSGKDNTVQVKWICPQCGLTFIDRGSLDLHAKEHVEDVAPPTEKAVRTRSKEVLAEKPTCGECGKVFSSRKTYRYHLNVLHKGQNRYPCPRCGKVYQWKSNLGRHLRTHKARDDGELYCTLCDKRFASVATFRQHLRVSRRHVSESEFSFVCNECGKKFVNKTRLRDHVDWEHLNKIKFRCQLCDKPFKCHTSLYVHLQNVHRNKEKKDNLCHVCGKSYQNAAKLKYHIVAMHTRETPYQCGQCGAAFGWYSSLYRHIREVHYKMKVQPKKSKKGKKLDEMMPPPLPGPA